MLAQKLQEQSSALAQPSSTLPSSDDLDELYHSIDEQAARLAPDEQACYTSHGQQLLLDAAVRVLPQLTMLNAPGFPGDRIRHAATGREAYQAMVDLTHSIRQLVKDMDRT